MCGLVGFIDFSPHGGSDELRRITAAMNVRLAHRGPDDSGVWVDPVERIALGHRRLSIIDLSAEGHQPMTSACGRYVIVFNGEIYNHQSLRRQLEKEGSGGAWRGHSDTEVMLAAIGRWGLKAAVQRFVGMFAFALWDRQERQLHLVRDRMGEKPLYYGWIDGAFLFGSELKALRAHPRWCGEVNRDALGLFMQFNCIPAPHTIYRGIYKLPPGCLLALRRDDLRQGEQPSDSLPATPYWSVKTAAEQGAAHPFCGTESEAVQRLDDLLRESVGQQMLADVPLGAFLSGGIDSSTVVSLMQAESSRPVRTFTIGINDPSLDEAGRARTIARHLGTDHTELYIDAQSALDTIPQLATLYDEPFADSSQIPTFLVSHLTRKHVTVSLSGDGGDELFAGYNTYFMTRQIWRTIGWLPQHGKAALAKLLAAAPTSGIDRYGGWLTPWLVRYGHAGKLSDKLGKLAEIAASPSPDQLFVGLVTNWKDPSAVVLGCHAVPTVFTDHSRQAELTGAVQRMMFFDQVGYLADDILVKLDRAAMGVSLETRVPLLDHRLVEFAWQLPLALKIRAGTGKWLLRQVLARYLPEEMVAGPKRGFEVPLGNWLRGPLRDWAEPLLDEARLHREGFFAPEPIRKRWQEHLAGRSNRQNSLWNVLTFQAWLEQQGAG